MQTEAQEELSRRVKATSEERPTSWRSCAQCCPEWVGRAPPGSGTDGTHRVVGRDRPGGFEEALGKRALAGDAARQYARRRRSSRTLRSPRHTRGGKGRGRAETRSPPRSCPGSWRRSPRWRRAPTPGCVKPSPRALGRTEALDPAKVVESLARLLGDKGSDGKAGGGWSAARPPWAPRRRRAAGTAQPPGAPVRTRPWRPPPPSSRWGSRRLGDADGAGQPRLCRGDQAGGRGRQWGRSGFLERQFEMEYDCRGRPASAGPAARPRPRRPRGLPPLRPWEPFRPAARRPRSGRRAVAAALEGCEGRAGACRGCFRRLEAIAATRTRMLNGLAGDAATLTAALGGKEDLLLAGLKGTVPDLVGCVGHKDRRGAPSPPYTSWKTLGPDAEPAAGAAAKAMADEDPFVRLGRGLRAGQDARRKRSKPAVPAALAALIADDNGDVRASPPWPPWSRLQIFDAAGRPQGGQPGGEGGRAEQTRACGRCARPEPQSVPTGTKSRRLNR